MGAMSEWIEHVPTSDNAPAGTPRNFENQLLSKSKMANGLHIFNF